MSNLLNRVRRIEAELTPIGEPVVVSAKCYLGLGPSAWDGGPMNKDASKGYVELESLAELAGLGEIEVVDSAHSNKD